LVIPKTEGQGWRAVALSTEIRSGGVKAVSVGNEPIVLFRDSAGELKALEDRCPHRRVPLSLGMVRSEGWLQCGYHGWSFDGATGRCMAIPNLGAAASIPKLYSVFPYRVAEVDGIVFVATANEESASPAPDASPPRRGKVFEGHFTFGLSRREFTAALLDGPGLILDTPAIRLSSIMVADPHPAGEWMRLEWAALRFTDIKHNHFIRGYKLMLRLELREATGEIRASLVRPDERVIAAAHMAVTDAPRGTSTVVWRSSLGTAGWSDSILWAASALGKAPISPRAQIVMAAVVALPLGPSHLADCGPKGDALYGKEVLLQRRRA
jgi:nitrite reductase/ring-hydroxylating ferredoxin subunit